MWDKLFELLPDDNFGLNLDPSHLYFMQIDHLAAVRDYADRIFHAHAKDTEVFDAKRAREGNFTFSFHSWWRYRMPGLGEINWSRFIDALLQIGYEGTLSTEHEDPIYEGSEAKIKQGLLLGRRHLAQYLP
jgi:sugar phosphate isomerase/epimerase